MPSVSSFRHLPSLRIIYSPLDIRRSDTITPTSGRPTTDDNDIKPRPLHIKKVENSPSTPFRKRGRGRQEGKEENRESNRGFLGKNMPPKPRVRGSSPPVLGQDRYNGKPYGGGGFKTLGTPPAEKAQDRALMERGWPGYHGLLQVRRRVSPIRATELIPSLRKFCPNGAR